MNDETSLRVAVVGAGGLGSKLGGYLTLAEDADVWLVGHRRDHVDAIRANGLAILYEDQQQVVYPHATTEPAEIGEVDVVIVLVKAYDTLAAARSARPLVGPYTAVLTFQNGLGNVEILANEFGERNCVVGVTFQGATLLEPGRVGDMGHGLSYIAGSHDVEVNRRLARLAALSSGTPFPIEIRNASEVDGLLWGKLAMVSGINPLAAILGVPNGTLGSVAAARDLSLDAIKETAAVAEAKGITLAFDPLERFEKTTKATAKMKSGTLLDVMRHRQTEIPAISGAIATEAERLGIATPVQKMLARLVAAIEATYEQRIER